MGSDAGSSGHRIFHGPATAAAAPTGHGQAPPGVHRSHGDHLSPLAQASGSTHGRIDSVSNQRDIDNVAALLHGEPKPHPDEGDTHAFTRDAALVLGGALLYRVFARRGGR